MTPERRARAVEVLRSFSDDVLQDAARELETKSSMVQRIEALERALEPFAARGRALIGYRGEQRDRLVQMLIRAEDCERARDLLDGPPDPERDRETRAEVERP